MTSPDFFPTVPSLATLASSVATPTTYRVDPNLRSPYTMTGAVGLERKVAKNLTVSLTYLNSHGVHQLLTANANAPLPSAGTRPFGAAAGNIYQYESAGVFNQNQVITNFNLRAGSRLTLFGFYSLNYANSDTAGVSSFPTNSYGIQEDYGRAAFDMRHRLFMGGSWSVGHGVSLSPFMIASSGQPFDITVGRDLNGDSIFNDRPAFATDLMRPSVVVTRWGAFDTSPTAGERIIPVNYGTGPGQFSLNLRLSKTFTFGRAGGPTTTGGFGPPPGGGPTGGGRGGPPGGMPGGGLGPGGLSSSGGRPPGMGEQVNRRYSLTFSLMGHNIFNTVNLGTPIGDLNSPLFGRSNSLAGGPFSTQAANRRVDVQVTFSF